MAIGFGLDHLLGWTPALTVLGTLGGAVMSFLNVYWKLQADERKHQHEIDEEKGKKP
jgi:hypothetical protein